MSNDEFENSIDEVLDSYELPTGICKDGEMKTFSEGEEIPRGTFHRSQLDKKYRFSSRRYTLEKEIGRGYWGTVFRAKDRTLNRTVAIKLATPNEDAKVMMQEKGIDLVEMLKRESKRRHHSANVLPAEYCEDNNGNPFIVMNVLVDKFMNQAIDDNGKRLHYKAGLWEKGLEIITIENYLTSLARGIADVHQKAKCAHGDIKPDNMALDGETVLLNDFGTATYAYDWKHPNGNRGFEFTRAPEVWGKDGHAVKQSDVWAFGSFAYRLFTGKYFLEDELKTARDMEELMTSLDSGKYYNLLQQKIQLIPKKYQLFVKRCLALNPRHRFENGTELERGLNDVIKKQPFRERIAEIAIEALGGAAALTGVSLAGAALVYGLACIEPEIKYIQTNTPRIIFTQDTLNLKRIEFKREDLPLPRCKLSGMFASLPYSLREIYSAAAPDPQIRYLVAMTDMVARSRGGPNNITDWQIQHYKEIFPDRKLSDDLPGVKVENELRGGGVPVWFHAVASSFEFAVEHSKKTNGYVDLEDVIAVARLGPKVVEEAKRKANSNQYADYRVHLPLKERIVIDYSLDNIR